MFKINAFFLLSIILLSNLVSCVDLDIEEKSENIKTPWIVTVSKRQDVERNKNHTILDGSCVGALIHPQAVLTTATCLHLHLEETKNLIVEANNQTREVTRVIFREYNPHYYLHNNYVLLKLSTPFLLSPELDVIELVSQYKPVNIRKCEQLRYLEKSSDNISISKVMGDVTFSQNTFCNQNMYSMYLIYKKTSIFWHPSVLCSPRLHILECIKLKDWSGIVTCAHYPESNNTMLAGFQINFLASKDDCIFVYANMFQASPWITEQLDNFFNDE